ncbi:pentapeptide repeat-containing protein [Streptomyces sp. NPDC002870]|uniref:pentapeptide repeat-containing protein n=1 Tax=Streptomyces sp. NPDC002870 TaxID=3364666 RepID=UPI0036954038
MSDHSLRTLPLPWPNCGHGVQPETDPVGCRGVHVTGHRACLAHLTDSDRHAYLAGLRPGSDLDHRGTPFTEPLLWELLAACRDPLTGRSIVGAADFAAATFHGEASFASTTFIGNANFASATFTDDAWFTSTTFLAHAWFLAATFEAEAEFDLLTCAGVLDLSRASFALPVTVEVAASKLLCVETRWESRATLRVRYAELDLSQAVFSQPSLVISTRAPLGPIYAVASAAEALLAFGRADATASVVSLSEVDAALVALVDLDLSRCRFSLVHHLDQLRMEGECNFARPPAGLRWRARGPLWWSARQVLAEEHHWRALDCHSRAARQGWCGGPDHAHPSYTRGPASLALQYRQLRKALEDGKNDPDAADFYFGEMEMRRNDRDRPWGERVLLAGYWALSGYGLRGARALGWLLGAMAATVLLMMFWGLPADDPKSPITGRITGQSISLTTDKTSVVKPTGPLRSRLTSERWEKSLRVVVNSVVFRSSGQDLTTTGTYIEMVSRLTEPVLLGLAVLAIRGRVKR